MHPGGDPPGRRGDEGDAGLPRVGRQLLRPPPHRARSATTGSRSAPTSPAGCAAATSCSTPSSAGAPRATRTLFVTGFECLGACDIAPMASIDQRYFGPLEAAEAGTAIDQLRAGAEVLPEKSLAKRPLAGDSARARAARRKDDCLMPHELETRVLLDARRGPARCARSTATRPGRRLRDAWRRPTREMEQDEVLKELEDSGLRGRGGAGFSMGKKASFLPRGDDGQVPLLQRRRVRARRLQGPRADAAQPAPADRGDRDRRPRRRRRPRLHLHPRRVRRAGRHPRRRGRRSLRGRLPRQEHPRLPTATSSWSSTAAPAPTSAARRPRCSTRSRASAATRA